MSTPLPNTSEASFFNINIGSMNTRTTGKEPVDQVLKLSASIIKIQEQMERLLAMQNESAHIIGKLTSMLMNVKNEMAFMKNQVTELRQNSTLTHDNPLISSITCDPLDIFAVPGEENQSFSLQKLKVLVVEDDATYQWLVSKYLQSRGIDCVVVGSAREALLHLQDRESFDLILMDVNLPDGVSGVDATRRIRSWNQKLPIISMTASTNPHQVREHLAGGMNAVLPKPFTKDNLLQMIDQFCKLNLTTGNSSILGGLYPLGRSKIPPPLLPAPPKSSPERKDDKSSQLSFSDLNMAPDLDLFDSIYYSSL